MWKKNFSGSLKPRAFKTQKINPSVEGEHDLFHRHSIIDGFDQSALDGTNVALVGAGGLGSNIGHALARKGVGALDIFDHDFVTITNLPRQFYYKGDLYKPKAICLARNLAKQATNSSTITGFPFTVQEAVARGYLNEPDVVIVGVDNSETRFFCSQNFYSQVPIIFTAVSPEADAGYVLVQEPGQACFGCLFPEEGGRPARPCTGSTIDIHKVMAGLVSYALDSLVMNRARKWNYKRIFLSGHLGDLSTVVQREPECPFCEAR